MISFRTHSLALLLAASYVLYPAQAGAETLESAVASAWQTHPSIEGARAGVKYAEEERYEEYSGYFPELSVSATGGRIFGDNSTSRGLSVTRGSGYSFLWEGTATVRQMLFDGFETNSRVDSARARKLAADLNLLDVKENLALRTAQAYIELMRARKGLAMLKTHENKVNDYLARIKTMVDEGASDESDYQQGRDIKIILEGFIADYEGQLSAAEASFLELTGRLPEGDMARPMPSVAFIPENAADAVAYAHENHPLILAAAYNAKSSAYDTDAEEAAFYPDVDGELSYLKNDKEDVIGGEVIDARAVVRLNWNFETGGAQFARVEKSRYLHKQAMARMHEVKRQIERDIRLAYNEHKIAQDKQKNQEKRRQLNIKLMDTYEVQFEGARITLLQLMQGDNQLFTTALEAMNAESRVLIAQYAILANMGRLQESLTQILAEAGPAADEQN